MRTKHAWIDVAGKMSVVRMRRNWKGLTMIKLEIGWESGASKRHWCNGTEKGAVVNECGSGGSLRFETILRWNKTLSTPQHTMKPPYLKKQHNVLVSISVGEI